MFALAEDTWMDAVMNLSLDLGTNCHDAIREEAAQAHEWLENSHA